MKRLIVFLIFLLLSIFWFWQEALGHRLFCFSDLTFYFYPYRSLMAEFVKSGIVPLWNPYLLMGYPFLATLQPGLFYPLSVLYYLLPFDLAFNWFLILHVPLAAFFMYLLCHDLKFSFWASVASGIVFAFSGYTLSVVNMLTTLSSFIWLPLVFLLFRRALLGDGLWQKLGNIVLSGIVLAVMFLGGEPTVLYGTFWVLLIYLVYLRFGQWRLVGEGVLLLALSGAIAAGLSAIQLLPFVELLRHSTRSASITFKEASFFALQPRKLIGFVFPYFFHLTEFPWIEQSWTKLPYLGFIPALLACLAFIFNKDKKLWWLGGAVILLILIMLGNYSPIPAYFLLFKFIPGFNLFRYPIKFMFIFVFIFSILAGLGLDLIQQNISKLKPFVLTIFILLFPLTILFFWMFYHQQQVFLILKPLFAEEIAKGWVGFVRNISVPRNIANFGIMLLSLLLLNILFLLGYLRKVRQGVFAFGLVLLVFLDLFTANVGGNFSVKTDDYQVKAKNVEILMRDKSLFRYFVAPDVYRRSHLDDSLEYYDYKRALSAMRNRLTANQNLLYRLSDTDAYESIRGADQETIIRKIWSLDSLKGVSMLDLMNVKYLVSFSRFAPPGYRLINVEKNEFGKGSIYLYRNKNVLPRAFFVPAAKIIANVTVMMLFFLFIFFPFFVNNFVPNQGKNNFTVC